MSQVAHIGAFSMRNYGDQIYPALIEGLLTHLGLDVTTRHFGLVPGRLPDGRAVDSINHYRPDGFDAAIVGGGDLIRVDRRVVALDHLCVPTGRRHRLAARIRAARFARSAIGDRPGPWLPSNGWGVPAGLASVGVHTLPPTMQIHDALAGLAGAWVRTSRGVQILRQAGMADDAVFLGPDAVFALPLVESAESAASRGRRVLARLGVDADNVVIIHAASFAGWEEDRLAALVMFCAPTPVALLPLGEYAGENLLLRATAQRAGVPYLGLLSAPEVSGVLAAAGCVVHTSMHAAIVAATYGRPAVAPGVAKTATAFEACPEPPELIQAEADEIPALVARLRDRERTTHSEANIEAVLDSARRLFDAIGLR